jgi:transposase InsO family protein
MEDARRREIALFRYALVRPAADHDLSPRDRGRLVRDLAARDHLGPAGQRVRVARSTLDHWIRDYRQGGFDALLPAVRRGVPRTDVELLDLAVRLKREQPKRTAAQVLDIIARSRGGAGPSERTLQRHFARLGLDRRPDGRPARSFGRFEAEHRNDRWTGDVLHGPPVAGRKAYLFAFLDDHARLVTGHRWGRAEDALRLEAALRRGLASRGVPGAIYVDNGSPFVSAQLQRVCAVLGIRLIHSRPGEPAGRGKIERFFSTVRAQFLVEVEVRAVADLDERGPAVHRLGRAGLPPPRAPRDCPDAAGALQRRGHPRRPHAGRAARGVPLGRDPHGDQDRDRVAARQPLRGRRRPDRAQDRAGLRPLRPQRPRGALPRPGLRPGGGPRHWHARPPARRGAPRPA